MKLWTVWLDYGGTGEGSTFAARVAYADDEQGALAGFEKVFGDFYARCAYAVEGVAENHVTRSLFAPEMLSRVAALEGRANVDLFAQYHFNAS